MPAMFQLSLDTPKFMLYGMFILLSCQGKSTDNTLHAETPRIPDTTSHIDRIRQINYTKAISYINRHAETGDIITRAGNDFTSHSLRSLNQRNKQFSHCGLIRIENGSPVVYHILGGEWNPDQKILRQTVAVFCNVADNDAIGLFRVNAPAATKTKYLDRLLAFQRDSITFDMAFDLKSDHQLYCSELVAKSIEQGTGFEFLFNRSTLGGRTFVGVDDIFLASFVHPVYQIALNDSIPLYKSKK
jgi:hypothetical protein